MYAGTVLTIAKLPRHLNHLFFGVSLLRPRLTQCFSRLLMMTLVMLVYESNARVFQNVRVLIFAGWEADLVMMLAQYYDSTCKAHTDSSRVRFAQNIPQLYYTSAI